MLLCKHTLLNVISHTLDSVGILTCSHLRHLNIIIHIHACTHTHTICIHAHVHILRAHTVFLQVPTAGQKRSRLVEKTVLCDSHCKFCRNDENNDSGDSNNADNVAKKCRPNLPTGVSVITHNRNVSTVSPGCYTEVVKHTLGPI